MPQPSRDPRAGCDLYTQHVCDIRNDHRRRGTVLILVMTILGILFVTGIAFMATMEFEADMISADRQRDRNERGVGAMVDEVSSMLQEGLIGQPGVPFGGRLDNAFTSRTFGDAPAALGEMQGVHNFFAPTEPYLANPGVVTSVRFRNFTDLSGLTGGNPNRFRSVEINPLWPSGVADVAVTGNPLDTNLTPVDSDGDGMTDTLQFDVTGLGFSARQVAQLSAVLNAEDNPNGKVFLGARIIAHGAMVNLNESHPLLIANALDLRNPGTGLLDPATYLLSDGTDPNLNFFKHTPACSSVGTPKCSSTPGSFTTEFYSPQVEESALRRRFVLPPETLSPTMLQGNPFLDPSASPTAGGDMAATLFPVIPGSTSRFPFETAFTGFHRSIPFSPTENVVPMNTSSATLWAAQVEPETAQIEKQLTGIDPFDRRHLVTTISHDDLLSRGGRAETFNPGNGQVIGDMDLRDWMIEVNRAADSPFNPLPTVPFEYVNYPHDIINETVPNSAGTICDTITSPVCRFDDRKGRLKLSLAWLDDAYDTGNPPGTNLVTEAQRERIIHDVFMMLVRNARGLAYDEVDCTLIPGVCRLFGETCDTSVTPNICKEPASIPARPRQTHRELAMSRTAASLTANMLDYADLDDLPTRIALRSFDFSEQDLVGRDIDPTPAVSYPIDRQYVYGLERQPYITEVATVTDGNVLVAQAVELFNPYGIDLGGDNDGDGLTDFWIFEVDAISETIRNKIPLTAAIRIGNGGFTVLVSGDATRFFPLLQVGSATAFGSIRAASPSLGFDDRSILYLVRKATYPDDPKVVDIVVDQFDLTGLANLAVANPPAYPTSGGDFGVSVERATLNDPTDQWKATVGAKLKERPTGSAHTLGNWNADDPKVRPVEVNFANTGSFTKFNPNPMLRADGVAFPTTGSMLLLMRHANRDIAELATTSDLAFTTQLGETKYSTVDTSSGTATQPLGDIPNPTAVDNGRMPIFDKGFAPPAGTGLGMQYAHHVDPMLTGPNVPGNLSNLPWGQLVFDYFTALPLAGDGPYRNTVNDPNFDPLRSDSQPRVDQSGLRVHGRININAAPWTVLAGLPLIPMNKMPFRFRPRVRLGAGLVKPTAVDPLLPTPGERLVQDNDAADIKEPLAQAIVAYRETRAITDVVAGTTTGNYDAVGGRGWKNAAPASRRGTGFLSIGELANVRHDGATQVGNFSTFRMDGGNLKDPKPDFVRAAAFLVAMGDWVSVRSDVFTVYGTIRGELDRNLLSDPPTVAEVQNAAADVDTRAIRFQETIDRLPTFSQSSEPARIGERISAKYIDVRND